MLLRIVKKGSRLNLRCTVSKENRNKLKYKREWISEMSKDPCPKFYVTFDSDSKETLKKVLC